MSYKWWRPRFSLRLLFALLTIAGVWLGIEANCARRQRIAVRAVTQSGGTVRYDYQRRSGNTGGEAPPAPGWLRKLLGDEYFQEVVEVNWNGKRDLSPDDLKWLADFPQLETVNLNFSNVNDDGLAQLVNGRAGRAVRELVGKEPN